MACSDQDYAYLRDLVLAGSANVIEPSRNALFDTRLTPVARLAGAHDLGALVNLLKTDRPAHIHRAVVEAMTINETSFFRDAAPFDALREVVLPALIERRQQKRTLRIWSAACATGQEPYSIAMLLLEHFPELSQWDIRIVATDISRGVLDYARRARFRRLEVNRGLPARMMLKYFVREADDWEAIPSVRALCDFRLANLCSTLPPLPIFDLVLLRNVLLYFPHRERGTVFGQIHQQLAPDGYLLLGNAEQAEDSTASFHAEFARQCYFYRPVRRQ